MEQKNDKGYFVVDMGIYPRKMYIVKGRNSGKVITDNFKGRNDLEINTADCSQDKCDVWDVVEKESLDKGFLIWLRLPPTIEDYAHEAVHVAFETFRDIGGVADEDNQEPFAYLVGWIAKQIKNALNYKETKSKYIMKHEDLKETVNLMNSSDYKDRFRAEFYQTETRCEKLKAMLDKYLEGTLTFKPTCSYNLLHEQYVHMCGYLECLKKRAELEKIVL